ncbi:MAG TPA: uroporphyrinogen-III synthase [Rhodocyclaceae bacterium]|nr:uroporphyrinogen-III synthase [Rhodocyclaceae bacterium]
MPAESLKGRRIVVTRPAGQAESLCAAIEARGGIALRFPVLAISPAADTGGLEVVVAQLDAFDLAFFVSPNAVRHALEFILARRTWPPRVAVATVGKGSERALHELGFEHVIAPQAGFDSEAVLALPEFGETAVAGRRIVIFRGDGGRDLLGDTLKRRGARVDYVTCYRRHRPDLDAQPLLDLARRGELAAITLTSSEGVGHFSAMLGSEGMTTVRALPVFASHPRIVACAHDAGFANVIETAPGDAGLIASLERHFDA